jgi:cysteine-rich repeat protein
MRTLIAIARLVLHRSLMASALASLALGLSMPAEGEDTVTGDNYIAINGGFLTFYTWDEGLSYCSSNYQTNLASIHSSEDLAEIEALLAIILSPGGRAWVGGLENPTDSEIFEWVDGTPWDWAPPWAAGEPDPGEDCVAVDGQWFVDDLCSAGLSGFVCNRYSVPVCGDGLIEGAEQCDDGGTTPGDGCDAGCQIESGWTCAGEPSVCSEQALPILSPYSLLALFSSMMAVGMRAGWGRAAKRP